MKLSRDTKRELVWNWRIYENCLNNVSHSNGLQNDIED